MTAAELRELIRIQHEDVWTAANFDRISDVYSEDFVGHFPGRPDWKGHDDVKWNVEFIHGVFPDWTEEMHDFVAADSHAASRWTSIGTHTGREFLGLEPSGARVAIPEMGFFHIRDGRVAEQWNTADHLIMYWQLGGKAIPDPAAD